MKITTKPCTMLVIENIMGNPLRLDPVRVICENLEPGRGRIIITCYDSAWVGFWGAMGTRSVEEFVISCGAEYIADNLGCSGHLRSGENHRTYLIRVITAAQEALRRRQPKASKQRTERLQRLDHVNRLVRAIGSHGRRFFWNEEAKRFARMEMDAHGKLWWIDDYRESRVFIEKVAGHEHRWRGFSHGGTLKDLVKMMREYVKTGELIRLGYIAPDYWGYTSEESLATIHKAMEIPCCTTPF